MTYNNSQYQAYKTASQTIDPTQQLIMLYEGAVGFVKKAKEAIENDDFETKFNMVNKVLAITAGLTSELEFNEETNETAKALDIYYQGLEIRLLSVQCNDSTEDCDLIIRDLQIMLAAWRKASEDANSNDEAPLPEENLQEPISTNDLQKPYADLEISV